MAINKLPSGNYQARLRRTDGSVKSKTFSTKREAEIAQAQWKKEKMDGLFGTREDSKRTVAGYFQEWFRDLGAESSQSGWRKQQEYYFRRFMSPLIGHLKITALRPHHVLRIFSNMTGEGYSPQTQRLVYSTLRKMCGDAVDSYQYLIVNPTSKKMRPKVPKKEAPHLRLEEMQKLLRHVDGKPYGLAIWVQFFLGLRLGELKGLRWSDLDLSEGRATIRRVWIEKAAAYRDYPKGGKQFTKAMPDELVQRLRIQQRTNSESVVNSEKGSLIHYNNYSDFLRRYCIELGFSPIGTHGLRHSSSELYLKNGASREDLREFFGHSHSSVTERYLHGRGTQLDLVVGRSRLFAENKSTTTVPRGDLSLAEPGIKIEAK